VNSCNLTVDMGAAATTPLDEQRMDGEEDAFNMADLPVAVEIAIIEYFLQTGSKGSDLPSWVIKDLGTEFVVRPPGIPGLRMTVNPDAPHRELDGLPILPSASGFDLKEYIPFIVRLKQLEERVFCELRLDELDIPNPDSPEHLAGVLAKEWWKWGQEARTEKTTKRSPKQERKKRGKSSTRARKKKRRTNKNGRREHPDGLVGLAEAQHHYQPYYCNCCDPYLHGGYVAPHDRTSEYECCVFLPCFLPLCIFVCCVFHCVACGEDDFMRVVNTNTAFVDALYLRDSSPPPVPHTGCYLIDCITENQRKASDFEFVHKQSASLTRFLSSRLRHLRHRLSDDSSVHSYDYDTYDSYMYDG